jgi:hypothetical protein
MIVVSFFSDRVKCRRRRTVVNGLGEKALLAPTTKRRAIVRLQQFAGILIVFQRIPLNLTEVNVLKWE